MVSVGAEAYAVAARIGSVGPQPVRPGRRARGARPRRSSTALGRAATRGRVRRGGGRRRARRGGTHLDLAGSRWASAAPHPAQPIRALSVEHGARGHAAAGCRCRWPPRPPSTTCRTPARAAIGGDGVAGLAEGERRGADRRADADRRAGADGGARPERGAGAERPDRGTGAEGRADPERGTGPDADAGSEATTPGRRRAPLALLSGSAGRPRLRLRFIEARSGTPVSEKKSMVWLSEVERAEEEEGAPAEPEHPPGSCCVRARSARTSWSVFAWTEAPVVEVSKVGRRSASLDCPVCCGGLLLDQPRCRRAVAPVAMPVGV